jgi:hypothetical protein
MTLPALDDRVDGVVIFPPPSPSDTNPPLGPALLARAASRLGVRLDVIDLNMMYIGRFRTGPELRKSRLIGDQGKDRPLLAKSSRALFDSFDMADETPMFLPDGADAVAGMHYSFRAVERTLNRLTKATGPLSDLLEDCIFSRDGWPPKVVGVSVMGPSQIIVAALLLRIVKKRWPQTTTVCGGSHVTLLQSEISGRH